MLERLEVERAVHGRNRNLLVAATGTGKTVLAALDYRNLRHRYGERPTLLFVAHRREILEHARRTYQEVLDDAEFGELLVGTERPRAWRHVFAGIQALTARRPWPFAPDHFDVVVVDEFHHAQAASYRALLDHVRPRELLGLTATPERADGVNVQDAFFDGRIAAELRLWEALDNDLLSPFHYFGVTDTTDLSGVPWRRGDYAADALDRLFTGNDARARLVLRAVRDKVADPHRMRASASRVRRARRVHGGVLPQGGPERLALSGKTPNGSAARSSTAARRHRPGGVLRRPVQRGRRPPRRGHPAAAPPHLQRDRVPPAARPRPAAHPGQGGADRPRPRRPAPPGVPVREPVPGPDQPHPPPPGRRDRTGLPAPAVGLPDRAGTQGQGRSS